MDLNGDVGEGFDDVAFLPHLSTASIACGGHAGDEHSMRETLRLAGRFGVSPGAHPGLADRAGFGRRAIVLSAAQTRSIVVSQVTALRAVATDMGAHLRHVKPHGELYNRAMSDPALWDAVVAAVAEVDGAMVLVGLAGPGSQERERVAATRGVRVVRELFADRAYRRDGSLVPRSESGAVIHDAGLVAERLRRYLREGVVETCDGYALELAAETICLHGDNPAAVELARVVRRVLTEEGVRIGPFTP